MSLVIKSDYLKDLNERINALANNAVKGQCYLIHNVHGQSGLDYIIDSLASRGVKVRGLLTNPDGDMPLAHLYILSARRSEVNERGTYFNEELADEIVQLFEDIDNLPLLGKKIASDLDKATSTVYPILTAMVEKGVLVRDKVNTDGRGRSAYMYQLPDGWDKK